MSRLGLNTKCFSWRNEVEEMEVQLSAWQWPKAQSIQIHSWIERSKWTKQTFNWYFISFTPVYIWATIYLAFKICWLKYHWEQKNWKTITREKTISFFFGKRQNKNETINGDSRIIFLKLITIINPELNKDKIK